MWTSIPTALAAILVLSSTTSAAVARTSSSAATVTSVSTSKDGGLATTVTTSETSSGETVDEGNGDGPKGVTTTTTTSSSTAGAANHGFLRGVNLGGWLILEKWMNPDTFQGDFKDKKDQLDFDQTPGAKEALKKHWDSFFTESDIQEIAQTGINALRIPVSNIFR